MSRTRIVICKFLETVIQLTDLATRYGLCECRRVNEFSFVHGVTGRQHFVLCDYQ